MSNLRIKCKKLKRELEQLKDIHSTNSKVVKLRRSLWLNEEDIEHLPECVKQIKYDMYDEVEDFIAVKVDGDANDVYLTLEAEISVVKED